MGGTAGEGPEEAEAPPLYKVQCLDDALRACARHGAVTLMSDVGAAGYAGAAWFKAIAAQAQATFPGVEITAVLDCGDQAGDALGALRCGIRDLIVDLPAPVIGRIREIAAATGARVANRNPTG